VCESVRIRTIISANFFFFVKQKTAYEIGLGIPAEPLFRSYSIVIGSKLITLNASGGIQGDVLATDNNTVGMGDAGIKSAIQGSKIGRASCRERVEIWGYAVLSEKMRKKTIIS